MLPWAFLGLLALESADIMRNDASKVKAYFHDVGKKAVGDAVDWRVAGCARPMGDD